MQRASRNAAQPNLHNRRRSIGKRIGARERNQRVERRHTNALWHNRRRADRRSRATAAAAAAAVCNGEYGRHNNLKNNLAFIQDDMRRAKFSFRLLAADKVYMRKKLLNLKNKI